MQHICQNGVSTYFAVSKVVRTFQNKSLNKGRGTRAEEQGPRNKGRGTRAEEQGPRNKGRGTRAEEQGARNKGRGTRAEEQGPRNKGRGTRGTPTNALFLLKSIGIYMLIAYILGSNLGRMLRFGTWELILGNWFLEIRYRFFAAILLVTELNKQCIFADTLTSSQEFVELFQQVLHLSA